MTKREKIIGLLYSHGWRQCESKTSKALTFEHPNKKGVFYFVGKRGAMRHGSCYSKSYSVKPNLND